MKQARLHDRDLDDLETDALQVLDEAADEHDPRHVFALYSGGHESLVASSLAMKWGADGIVHLNTGCGAGDHENPARVIERVTKTRLPAHEKTELIDYATHELPLVEPARLPNTRTVVRETCTQQGWNLLEYRAEDHSERLYEDMVLEHGFPGPAQHTITFSLLKQRPLRQVIRDHKTGRLDRVMLVSGVREHESTRRMGVAQEQYRNGAQLFVNPCLPWLGSDTNAYLREHELPRSPVKDYLEMSGECLCGSFAEDRYTNERLLIREMYPRTIAWFSKLEEMAEKKGLPSRWGVRPSEATWGARPEVELEESVLCRSCPTRHGGIQRDD